VKILIKGGTLITPGRLLEEHDILVEETGILAIESRGVISSAEIEVDARDMWVVPGFIDLHIHGSNGFDTMDATREALHGIAEFVAKHGVTSYLPTTISAPAESISDVLEVIRNCPRPGNGAIHLGIHIEGPYLNQRYKGAQPSQHIRSVNPEEYEDWILPGLPVVMVTLAPENDEALAFINKGRNAGIIFAVGHSEADYERVLHAADLGLTHASHLFNGMPPFHHRKPGIIGAVLTDNRLLPQIIADGVHLHPATVKLVVSSKGIGKTILITDATRGTGLGDGNYLLGDQVIHINKGIARTEEGSLAGSTLTMDLAIKNTMEFTGLSLQEVVTMATLTPATSVGLGDRKGVLAVGADADLVLLDRDYRIRMTMVSGRIVYGNM